MRNPIFLLPIILLAAACHKTAPQRPTRLHENKNEDTTLVAMMTMNERMANAADRKVLSHIRALCQEEGVSLEERWTRLDGGAWLRRVTADEAAIYEDYTAVQKDEKWLVHLGISNLDGETLADRDIQATIGRQELPPAVEEVIQEMHEGETRVVIAPWYAAYGPVGDTAIRGYENVQIEICVRQKI